MGKPMLIVSNKQDLPGALDPLDICDYFEVEYLANLFRTPCFVEGIGRYNQEHDSQLAINACSWLVKTIVKNYKSIQNKIRFLRVVTQNESLSSNDEIPRRSRRPATGKRKVSVKNTARYLYLELIDVVRLFLGCLSLLLFLDVMKWNANSKLGEVVEGMTDLWVDFQKNWRNDVFIFHLSIKNSRLILQTSKKSQARKLRQK